MFIHNITEADPGFFTEGDTNPEEEGGPTYDFTTWPFIEM